MSPEGAISAKPAVKGEGRWGHNILSFVYKHSPTIKYVKN